MQRGINQMEGPSHQRVFQFEGLVLSSQFEGGNLEQAEAVADGFLLWVGRDHSSNHYRTWFNFRVQGQSLPGTTLTFTIKNFNNQARLFKEGHLPVYRQAGSEWRRIKQPINLKTLVNTQEGLEVAFKHSFQSEMTQFAFAYPWTLTDSERLLADGIQKAKHLSISMSSLCTTLGGLPLRILSIARPEDKVLCEYKGIKVYDKKGIFISARVHPGQTPASHVMNGVLKQLFRKSELAQEALSQFSFYIVPILNPDGVVRGHYRTNTRGQNLNRFYDNPDEERHPQIFAVKQFVLALNEMKRFFMAVDLHAHAGKRGIFIYGNHTANFRQQVDNMLFAKLLSLNSRYFQMDGCNFSAANMVSKDEGEDLSKEGSARVSLFKATSNIRCYTLECNYNTGKSLNILSDGKKPLKSEPKVNQHSFSKAVVLKPRGDVEECSQPYSIYTFQSIGGAILESALQLVGGEAQGRLKNSPFRNLVTLKMNIAAGLLRQVPYRNDPKLRKLNQKICFGDQQMQGLSDLYQYLQEKQTTISSLKDRRLQPREVASRAKSLAIAN